MTESLVNGERGVVVLFVSRVLYCLPHCLIYEGLALCLLSFAGLLLEILAENSASLTRFKTRLGASSGILLGAVTLPTVLLSRLIQLLRVLPSDNIRPHEIGSQTVQYWVVSISCLSVLVYLCKVLHQSAEATSYFRRWSLRDAILSILYIIFYASCCYLSLTKSPGLHVTMKKLLWVLCHGFAAVKLIQHFLHTFPSCASIGEALLVTAGFNLYFGDMLGYTLSKLDANSTVAKLVSPQNGIRSEISIIIQGVLVGLLLFPVFYKFIVRIHGHFSKSINSEACAAENNTSEGIERSVVFYCSLAVVLLLMVPAWMQFVKDFHIHPFLWVLDFVFSESQRLLICIFWTLCICVSVVWFYRISKNSKTERILLRKYYHLVAVVMFSPALIKEPHFLDLAFGAALAVFLVLEIIRVWKIWPLGKHVHRFMNAFTDHRDSDLLIISHFSLLLGCALPKWMSSGSNDRPFAPFAGILTLGIGDAMASIIGYKYGMFRWNKTGKKTVEGTAAGITSVMVACSCLHLASTDYTFSQNWLSLLFAVIASGLLEAYTAQLDNAFIPLVFYSLLCL